MLLNESDNDLYEKGGVLIFSHIVSVYRYTVTPL